MTVYYHRSGYTLFNVCSPLSTDYCHNTIFHFPYKVGGWYLYTVAGHSSSRTLTVYKKIGKHDEFV